MTKHCVRFASQRDGATRKTDRNKNNERDAAPHERHPSMKHLDGLRLIALAVGEEPPHLLAGLVFAGGLPCLLDRLRPALCRNESGEIGQLPPLPPPQLLPPLSHPHPTPP